MKRPRRTAQKAQPKEIVSMDGQAVEAAGPDGATLETGAGAATPGYTEDDVRRRAYELYLGRDNDGRDAEADWYAAEEELKARNPL